MTPWGRLLLFIIPVVLSAGETPITRPDTPPEPRHRPAPTYPGALKEQRLVGSVLLIAVIDESGRVTNLAVDSATRTEFAQAALAAVATWQYAPATKDGQPRAVRVAIPVEFQPDAATFAEFDARRPKEELPPGPPIHPVDALDHWPELKKEIRPDTPEVLRRERRMGQTVIRFIVDETGTPRDVHALVTTHGECAEEATRVVKRWRFSPGRKDGQAVRTSMEATLVFFPENQKMSGFRVKPGARSGEDGFRRLPDVQQAPRELKQVGRPPKVLKQPPPEYPHEMSARGKAGRIVVEFIIDTHGRVTHVRSSGDAGPFFAAVAERAVSQWTFQPATVDGRPVVCRVRQQIDFNLRYR